MTHDRSATFPLLPLRGGVLLPGTAMTIPVGRRKSIALLESLPRAGEAPEVVVAVQRDARVNDPLLDDLHPIATVAQVVKVARAASSAYMVTLRGLYRVELEEVLARRPYWSVVAGPAEEPQGRAEEGGLLAEALVEQLLELEHDAEGALARAINNRERDADPGHFADQVAGSLDLTHEQAVRVLLAVDVVERLREVTRLAGETLTAAELKRRIKSSVREAFDKQQRESILRQQMHAIRKELGEEEEGEADELESKLAAKILPDEVRHVVDRELKRLRKLSPVQAEHNVVRTYLEVIAELPWNERAEVADDLDAVEQHLDDDHFGLEQVKRRILEHMAVLKLSGNPRGTVLCLSGPPGTGKTSLARSIAEATGRPFVRIALGGVRDEAEIRGHRRTYVGALPGRLINGLRKAKARNPVMLLDEIDKLSEGGMRGGSPEAALLEVLDPEQNAHFTDHYLELPFDLSEVLFICTANVMANLTAPLRDRLEIVEVEGYTYNEKLHIARDHLLPRQLERHGIGEDGHPGLELSDDALDAIIHDYTRESGVRQLEREIIRLCRAAAYEVARGTGHGALHVDAGNLQKHLGKPRFREQLAERTALPGVATGLAWTPVGGDILFIETSRMPGRGRLEITGQLGDVMKESARAALTYVRSNANALGIDPAFLDRQDLHIHVPAGAIPKDGPSAGVTIFTAFTSLLTGRRVRADVAMTGECTLRGRVLAVGGIKAKVLAAHRAGIRHVILPHQNERDIDEVPEEIRSEMSFTLADDMSEVLAVALEEEPVVAPSVTGDVEAPSPSASA